MIILSLIFGIVQANSVGQVDEKILKEKHENIILSKHISKEYKIPFSLAKEIVELVKIHTTPTNIPPKLVLAIIAVESSFQPNAVSPAGAKGLMQVMPFNRPGKTIEENVIRGIWILQDYTLETKNIYEAIMSYNIGIGNFKNGMRNYTYAKKVMKHRKKFEDVLKNKF